MDSATDVLLIGGGVASVRCARTLRREGFAGRIVLVGDEPTPPYNRPPLSKELLRDDLPDDLVLAEPARWYERHDVELVGTTRVAELDLDAQEAALADGTRVRFGRLLIATGAEPRPLPVPGGDGALLLRTLDDARRIREAAIRAGPGAPVAVVGGGFIGVELASSLAALGLRPVILERTDALWGGALGSELGAWALARLEEGGVRVRLRADVTRLADGAAWSSSERIEASFVAVGIGVRPRDEQAAAAGLEVADGISTDAAHRTDHPTVWAAGDVARVAGRRIEHWHAAREGGERAARSMLDLELPPAPPPWFFSEVAGVPFDVIGLAEGWTAEKWVADGVLAHLDGRRVAQLAIIGGAMPPERGRSLVAAGASAGEVRAAARAG